jgi:hypothetical protein
MEASELTMLDCMAHSDNRVRAGRDTTIPCWLVTDDRIRKEARERVLAYMNRQLLNKGVIFVPMTEQTFQATVLGIVPQFRGQFESWLESEKDREAERAAGNPKAWFV